MIWRHFWIPLSRMNTRKARGISAPRNQPIANSRLISPQPEGIRFVVPETAQRIPAPALSPYHRNRVHFPCAICVTFPVQFSGSMSADTLPNNRSMFQDLATRQAALATGNYFSALPLRVDPEGDGAIIDQGDFHVGAKLAAGHGAGCCLG